MSQDFCNRLSNITNGKKWDDSYIPKQTKFGSGIIRFSKFTHKRHKCSFSWFWQPSVYVQLLKSSSYSLVSEWPVDDHIYFNTTNCLQATAKTCTFNRKECKSSPTLNVLKKLKTEVSSCEVYKFYFLFFHTQVYAWFDNVKVPSCTLHKTQHKGTWFIYLLHVYCRDMLMKGNDLISVTLNWNSEKLINLKMFKKTLKTS